MKNVENLLKLAWQEYSKGNPFMTDAEFDALADMYDFDTFEEYTTDKKLKHTFRMYSLKKVFDDDESPIKEGEQISSPKLDGTAISLQYEKGILVSGITRGDGIEGEDITAKVYNISSIPNRLEDETNRQITGEIVCPKDIENARNYASGKLHLKDIEEFKAHAKNLNFIAYGIYPYYEQDYTKDMEYLGNIGFNTVLSNIDFKSKYRTDGTVFRVNSNTLYDKLGFTSKHPRGAYARKLSSDVEIKKTVLLDVNWQVGRTGQITPVAIFDEIEIDDAKINRATLHNPGFIKMHNLEIGDIILVTRSGGIIPKVLGKE